MTRDAAHREPGYGLPDAVQSVLILAQMWYSCTVLRVQMHYTLVTHGSMLKLVSEH